ncbi:MAG: ABC transporter ATP-binding protein [Clostridia bacterium]|nr:ABC transporter ATP-binding protein [Clostridia bacterium]MDR3644259.1 ABC transporter ATP-binding protein [Clostridia bacterium]
MICAKNLCKKFGDFTAIEDLSFTVEKSSIYGLVGYNGAGKTTLLKTIAGIYRPDGGKALVDGESIFDNEGMKRRMFFVPDDLYFLPQAGMNRMRNFYRGYYPGWSDKTYRRLVDIFGLDASKKINGFSKGMQRQAALILGLSTRPEYLLLDESFDGLDPAKRALCRQLLVEVMAEKEMCVLISSHNLRELEDLCDHVGFLNDRHIVYDCSLDDMRANKNKFRVAFKEKISEDAFAAIPHKNYTQSGNIASFVADGDAAAIEREIEKLNPALVESMPLTLEEIFLTEMEAKSYDFKGIF